MLLLAAKSNSGILTGPDRLNYFVSPFFRDEGDLDYVRRGEEGEVAIFSLDSHLCGNGGRDAGLDSLSFPRRRKSSVLRLYSSTPLVYFLPKKAYAYIFASKLKTLYLEITSRQNH